MSRQSGMSHYNEMNVLSMHALIGAYQDEGHQWVVLDIRQYACVLRLALRNFSLTNLLKRLMDT